MNWFKHNKILTIAISLIIFATFIRDILSIQVNQYVLLILASFFLAVLRKQQCLNYCFFLMPLLCGIQGYILTAMSIAIVSKSNQRNRICLPFIIIIAILEIINNATFTDMGIPFFKQYILYISSIIMFFYMLFYEDKDIDIIVPARLFLIGLAYVMFIIILRSYLAGDLTDLAVEQIRLGYADALESNNMNETQFSLNPNSLAFYSLVTLTSTLSFNKYLRFPNGIVVLLVLISCVTGAFTFSRTWMLCVCLYFILNIMMDRKKSNFKYILLGLCIIIAGIFLFPQISNAFLEGFMQRFELDNVETAGGRLDIYMAYNDWIFDNNYEFFGIGILNYAERANIGHACHSGLQQIFIAYGFFGLLLFSTSAFLFAKRYLRTMTFLLIIPFITCLIFDQSIQLISNSCLLLPFLLLTMVPKEINYNLKTAGK